MFWKHYQIVDSDRFLKSGPGSTISWNVSTSRNISKVSRAPQQEYSRQEVSERSLISSWRCGKLKKIGLTYLTVICESRQVCVPIESVLSISRVLVTAVVSAQWIRLLQQVFCRQVSDEMVKRSNHFGQKRSLRTILEAQKVGKEKGLTYFTAISKGRQSFSVPVDRVLVSQPDSLSTVTLGAVESSSSAMHLSSRLVG